MRASFSGQMATPTSWSNYAYDTGASRFGIGAQLTLLRPLNESMSLLLNGGYDFFTGSFTSSITSQSATLYARYPYALAGMSFSMGDILPLDSWVEVSGGVAISPVIGSIGIPSRNDQFSSAQSLTWAGAVKYVMSLEINEFVDAHFGLGYLFIPTLTALLPGIGGGGSSESVSVNLGSIRADAGLVFYF